MCAGRSVTWRHEEGESLLLRVVLLRYRVRDMGISNYRASEDIPTMAENYILRYGILKRNHFIEINILFLLF